MVGKVRTPLDEYQMAQKRNKAIIRKDTSDPMPVIIRKDTSDPMPVATEAGSTTGKKVKMKSDNPAIKKKMKGYSSEIM